LATFSRGEPGRLRKLGLIEFLTFQNIFRIKLFHHLF
jgi:hypothetical protein